MQMTADNKNFGDQLRNLYQAKNYTRKEIANALMVSPERMAEIETGVDRPNEEESFLLGNILNVDIGQLRQGHLVERKSESQIRDLIDQAVLYVRETEANLEKIRGILDRLYPNLMEKESEKLRPEKVTAEAKEKVRSEKVTEVFARKM
ncbi:MAG: helix-turn-helix transcriptional regulator [Lachnospiraceae bacterium]|nr:helix-turn-helix transcriptional regulator [Lachnospiraceae bacterium]